MLSNLFLLFIEFFKIGLFTIGGGLATIPFLNELAINRPTWITQVDISNMIAISQSTPGPLGVNMATFTGYKVAGILGGVIASLGLAMPAFIIILIISKYLSGFNKKWYVKDSLYGLRSVVLALIIYAVSKIFLISLFNDDFSIKYTEVIIFLIIILIYRKLKIHPLFYIGAGAIIGIVLKLPS
ncbi:MAG: chromate transporter [Sphaerochaetaceae bacterium]|nr:chromate transporter [Sphaerochaetaceae bacterium]